MSAEGASSIAQSQLDLYDFFSMLLPGTYLLIGLIPLLPDSLPLGTIGSAVVLLVGGYVVGRAIHSAAERYDERNDIPSHRDDFIYELKTDELGLMNSDSKDRFYQIASKEFDLSTPTSRSNASDADLAALYVHVRSKLYQHGNVRSQSFQAIYAFYRSAHFATIIIVFCYLGYGIGDFLEVWTSIGSYSTYIGKLDLPFPLFLLSAEIVLILSLVTLRDAKHDYRLYFIEYLFADYLSITCDTNT